MEFVSKSIKETQKIAADLAQKIIKTKNGAIVALEGELGAGKTTFIQGFAKALGVKSKIKSPTFVLMKKYIVPKLGQSRRRLDCHLDSQGVALTLYHLDCYRIGDDKDLKIPGLKEIFEMSHNKSFTTSKGSRKRPQHYATQASHNVVIIEWAERIKKILPKKYIKVHIDHIGNNERKIIVINNF